MEARFSGESKPAKIFARCFDVVLLNLIFIISCIPVVTIGPACTALYYTCNKVFQKKEGSILKSYFRSFRENFKVAFFVWIGYLVLIALVAVTAVTALLYVKGMPGAMMGGFCVASMAFVLAAGVYLFPVLSRFTLSGKELVRNTMIFMVTHGAATVKMTGILLLFFALVVIGFPIEPLILLVAPVLFTNWMSKMMEPVLAKYMPKEEKVTEEYDLEGGGEDEQEII